MTGPSGPYDANPRSGSPHPPPQPGPIPPLGDGYAPGFAYPQGQQIPHIPGQQEQRNSPLPQGRPATRWGKWLLLWVALLVALVVAYVAASPYVAVYRMKAAAERQDSKALSCFIDFPTLRQSLKDQFDKFIAAEADNQTSENDPFGAMGTAIAGSLADHFVDAYITPAGVERLMSGQNLSPDDSGRNEGTGDPFSGASMAYESVSRFVVTIKDEDGEDVRFVYRPRGIGWKLTEIEWSP